MKQMNFDAKMDELTAKPPSHITQEDARELQTAEVNNNDFKDPWWGLGVSVLIMSFVSLL